MKQLMLSQRILPFLCCLFAITVTVHGQKKNGPVEKAIIYYKDGSIFKGEILEDQPLHYKMLLSTLDTISINKSLVGRFASVERMDLYHKGGFHYKEGLYIYLTGMIGGGNGNVTALTDMTIGYRRTPQQSIGLGMGLAVSDATIAGSFITHQFTTLFLYGRQYINKAGVKIYFDSRVGYGFSRATNNFLSDDHSGGVHFQPGVGVHFASKSGLKWHVGIGRFIQRTTGQDISTGPFNQPIETNFKLWYSRTLFKVGLEIK